MRGKFISRGMGIAVAALSLAAAVAVAQAESLVQPKQCPSKEELFKRRVDAVRYINSKDSNCDAKGSGTCKGKCVNGGKIIIGLGEEFRATRTCKCATLH